MIDDKSDLIISGAKVRIREKRVEDARNDYLWCRDPELSRLDAAFPLNMSFSQYSNEYGIELKYPSLYRKRFAIETLTGEHIGNCSYYNIDTRRGETEVGIMIGNLNYWNQGYGTDTINTLVRYIFENTDFQRLYLKTLEWNIRAQQCFLKCGFTTYNRIARDGYRFLMMELTRTRWQRNRQRANQGHDQAAT